LIAGYLFIAIVVILLITTLKRVIKKEKFTAKDRAVPIILLGVGFLYIIALAFHYSGEIQLSDRIQILLMFGLVAVTSFYAWSASRQADASVKMAEEMRNARYDTVRPIIDIQRGGSNIAEAFYADCGDTTHGLLCILHNIGLGPAIDVCSLVQPPWAPWGRSQHHDFGTLAIGEESTMNLSLEQEDNRTALVVYYKDVYGRAFESSREVQAGETSEGWKVGPLQIRPIEEGENND